MRQGSLVLSGHFKRLFALYSDEKGWSDIYKGYPTMSEADKLRYVLQCYLAEYLPDNNDEERAIIRAIVQLV